MNVLERLPVVGNYFAPQNVIERVDVRSTWKDANSTANYRIKILSDVISDFAPDYKLDYIDKLAIEARFTYLQAIKNIHPSFRGSRLKPLVEGINETYENIKSKIGLFFDNLDNPLYLDKEGKKIYFEHAEKVADTIEDRYLTGLNLTFNKKQIVVDVLSFLNIMRVLRNGEKINRKFIS